MRYKLFVNRGILDNYVKLGELKKVGEEYVHLDPTNPDRVIDPGYDIVACDPILPPSTVTIAPSNSPTLSRMRGVLQVLDENTDWPERALGAEELIRCIEGIKNN